MRTVSTAPVAKSFLRSLGLVGTCLILTRMQPAARAAGIYFFSLLLPNQRAGYDVMQTLFAICERHHDEADVKAEVRENFCEEAPSGTGKINGPAFQIGYLQPQKMFAD